MSDRDELRRHARVIWQAAVDAVKPNALVPAALDDPRYRLCDVLRAAPRILVLGTGKAGAAMAVALEQSLPDLLDRIEGQVNIPAGTELPTQKIRLFPARPAGSNHPTAQGVAGTQRILEMAAAGPDDVALCLISGGGSALLPAPAPGISLEDKQQVTHLLHACGATIHQMNAVRKHLSAVKGGRLAQAFRGRALYSLIISDVLGDPLDVIASGPTAADPTTFADALAVLDGFRLRDRTPAAVLDHLQRGAAGAIDETCKILPAHIHNLIIGNNRVAYEAAWQTATKMGYEVIGQGTELSGEAAQVARSLIDVIRRLPHKRSLCILAGGETTVALTPGHGKGGRNQELVLAALCALADDPKVLNRLVLLSGGTDGEDGPTDAAGALADAETLIRAGQLGLDPAAFLARHDAYHFFEATGDLLKTGPTHTNVMDVIVFVVEG